jgi:hypothetical protein
VGHRRNRGNQKFLKANKKWKYNQPEPMGHSKGSPMRKVYCHESIY